MMMTKKEMAVQLKRMRVDCLLDLLQDQVFVEQYGSEIIDELSRRAAASGYRCLGIWLCPREARTAN